MSSPAGAPAPRRRVHRRTILKWGLTLLVLAAMGAWVYFKGDELQAKLSDEWSRSHLSFSQFGFGFFFAGLAIYFVSVLSTFFRWRALVTALHIPLSKLDAIRLGFVGYVPSTFLPGSITGDVVKAGFLFSEHRDRKMAALASIVVDRFIGLYSLFLLASIVSLFNLGMLMDESQTGITQLRLALFTIWGITLAGIALFLLFVLLPLEGKGYLAKLERVRFVGRFLSKLLRAFGQYRRHYRAVLVAVLIGMAGHVGFVLTYYFASRALPGPGETPSWQVHFLIIPFFMVFQAVPLTLGGNLGVGDVVLGGLYEMLGATLTKGVLASLFQRILAWAVALIGLMWYVPLQRTMKAKRAAKHEPAAVTAATAV